LRGFYFSPTQMELTGAIVEAKYPSGKRCRLRLPNLEMIRSLQQQTAGEPHAPYHIKALLPPPPPRSRPGEGGPLI
jgi:hypothetical protein